MKILLVSTTLLFALLAGVYTVRYGSTALNRIVEYCEARLGLTRGFCAGLALVTPFLINPLPMRFAALALLPLAVHVVTRGVRWRGLTHLDPILVLIYALIACMVAALAAGTTPFVVDVGLNLALSGGLIGIFLLAVDGADRPQDIPKGFFFGICVTGVAIGLAGLVKYWLQLNGVLFGALINGCFGRYPQGTTFCGDYNLFGLYMVIAAVGFSIYLLNARRLPAKALFTVCLVIVLTAGIFAGSRRFAFVAMTVPVTLAAYAYFNRRWLDVIKLAVVPAVLTTLLFVFYIEPRLDPNPEDFTTIGQVSDTVVGLGTEGTSVGDNFLAARSVDPGALAATMDAESAFGFNTRLERWAIGFEMVKEDGFLIGRGLVYQEEFSCRFVECEYIDYPHLPILSAWIAFGLAGLLLVAGIYLLVGLNAARAGREGLLSGVTVVTLSVLPYSMISGDNIFSIPHFFVGVVLVLSVLAERSPFPWQQRSATKAAPPSAPTLQW